MTKTSKAALNSTMISKRARPEILAMGGYVSARSIEKSTTGTIFLDANECGFEPFTDARNQFDVRFYLVAILFIVFDLEVAFLFPWAVSLKGIGMFGFLSMLVFLGLLTIGFIYEWKKGALEWD